jgi:hypothetical protein
VTPYDKEQRLNEAGYFLRDDKPIREGSPHFAGIEEAYSLHTVSPFQRYAVYGGPKSWAVNQAWREVFKTDAPPDTFELEIRRTHDGYPEIHRAVIVSGGMALWTGSAWYSLTGDYRPIQWQVKWWAYPPKGKDEPYEW